ncbi:hypothetical protein [Vibrio paucivorans]
MAYPKLTQKEFLHKATLRWGDKYGYQQALYRNSRTQLKIYCKKHKSYFLQTPKSHFYTKHECCPLCYKEVSGTFQNEWRLIEQKEEALNIQHQKLINQVLSDEA